MKRPLGTYSPRRLGGTPIAVSGLAVGLAGLATWRVIATAHRWGATDDEVARSLPGDDLLDAGASSTTYAITVDATPEQVWPWLLQIGRGRGGFYTYTWIERILGADIDNLDRVDPGLQTLQPGDRIWMTPERYLGSLPGQYWRVVKLEPGRAIVMHRFPPDSAGRATWTLLVDPTTAGRTRLIDRHRAERSRGALGRGLDLFWLVGTLIMERGMLRGIKARAQRASQGLPGRI